MQIVQNLAGYTLGRADLVRRAMAKKKQAVMLKERQNFVYGNEAEGVKGCVNNGIPEAVANHIFDEMTDFASYAFNKSHAACYAIVSYQTAWLKVYYPAEYMAALMTSVIDNIGKTAEYIQVCRGMGLNIKPPDINRGQYGFTAIGEEKTILYGLSAIKGVGRSVVEEICAERSKNGLYTDMEDFVRRMPKSVNKKAVEGFIKAGAFDCFPGNRRQKLLAAQDMIDRVQSERRSDFVGQLTLFDLASQTEKQGYRVQLPKVPEFGKGELLALEKEALGVYLSGHPIENHLEAFERIVNTRSTAYQADEETGVCALHEGQRAVSGGIIFDKKTKITKSNKQMAFLSVEDLYGQFEVLVFPAVFDRVRALLELDSKIYISGHVSIGRDENASLIADDIVSFDDTIRELWLAFADKTAYKAALPKLSAFAAAHPGKHPTVCCLREERLKRAMEVQFCTAADDVTVEAAQSAFGAENVRLRERGVQFRNLR